RRRGGLPAGERSRRRNEEADDRQLRDEWMCVGHVRTPVEYRDTALASVDDGNACDQTVRVALQTHYAEPANLDLSFFSRRPVSDFRRASASSGYGYRRRQLERIDMEPTPAIDDEVVRNDIHQLIPALSTTLCRTGLDDLDAAIE